MRRTIVQVLSGAVIVCAATATLTPVASAATIPVTCGETALVNAVILANSTPTADILALAGGCVYTMTTSHGSVLNGQDALPVITTPIEMVGPATITRSSMLPYRIAEVASTGNLTLTTAVTITNGSALGDGGGILNFGAVTFTNSFLDANTATGRGGGLANADTPTGTPPAATFTRSPVSHNVAMGQGGGIYNGTRGSLTTSGVTGSPLSVNANSGSQGGGIAAVNATATTLTQTAVTLNAATLGSGGVYRLNGTMTTNNTPISANTPNNCVGSVPAVPSCTG